MVVHTVALAALWWLLAGSDPAGWRFGAPLVVGGAWVARRTLPVSSRPRLLGLVRFALSFAAGAVVGGIDVALRVLRPSLPIAPVFLVHRLERAAPGAARGLFVAALSLMPGTLAAALDGDLVTIHALDRRFATPEALSALEDRAAAVFPAAGTTR
jgi:multicomponent Na+:H+ antiporter subunit E